MTARQPIHPANGGSLLVAIDGPAGSGKSSVSREAASRLGFGILDTGAAYRSLALIASEKQVELGDEDALLAVMDRWTYRQELAGEPRVSVLYSDGDAYETYVVTEEIRAPEVSAMVSQVAKHPRVRERLNEMFRQIVAHSGLPGVVIEGRDITTVVAPDAPVRILMTASAEVRARRRLGDLPGAELAQVLADIQARDAKDALVVDFFTPAPGVTLLDTSELDFEQSVTAVMRIVRSAGAHSPALHGEETP